MRLSRMMRSWTLSNSDLGLAGSKRRQELDWFFRYPGIDGNQIKPIMGHVILIAVIIPPWTLYLPSVPTLIASYKPWRCLKFFTRLLRIDNWMSYGWTANLPSHVRGSDGIQQCAAYHAVVLFEAATSGTIKHTEVIAYSRQSYLIHSYAILYSPYFSDARAQGMVCFPKFRCVTYPQRSTSVLIHPTLIGSSGILFSPYPWNTKKMRNTFLARLPPIAWPIPFKSVFATHVDATLGSIKCNHFSKWINMTLTITSAQLLRLEFAKKNRISSYMVGQPFCYPEGDPALCMVAYAHSLSYNRKISSISMCLMAVSTLPHRKLCPWANRWSYRI